MASRRLVLHVGLSKSGTTALQAAVAASRDELDRHGVAVPLAGRSTVERLLLSPLGWEAGAGFVGPVSTDAVLPLLERLRRVDRPVAFVSNEDLAELDAEIARVVVEAARSSGYDVDVLVTARRWSLQLPSEYQQFLKHRLTSTYPDFLEDVRCGEGFHGRHFRLRQDAAAVCSRWSTNVAPERVHVVVLPRDRRDRDFLFTEVARLLGVPATLLGRGRRDANLSYGAVEAEVYRRLNVELERLLPQHRPRTFGPVRRMLSEGVLRRDASPRLALPPEHLTWVRAESERQVAALLSGGYCLHGDPSCLLVGREEVAPPPVVTEADLARAAVETLARFAVRAVMTPAPPGRPAPPRSGPLRRARDATARRVRDAIDRAWLPTF